MFAIAGNHNIPTYPVPTFGFCLNLSRCVYMRDLIFIDLTQSLPGPWRPLLREWDEGLKTTCAYAAKHGRARSQSLCSAVKTCCAAAWQSSIRRAHAWPGQRLMDNQNMGDLASLAPCERRPLTSLNHPPQLPTSIRLESVLRQWHDAAESKRSAPRVHIAYVRVAHLRTAAFACPSQVKTLAYPAASAYPAAWLPSTAASRTSTSLRPSPGAGLQEPSEAALWLGSESTPHILLFLIPSTASGT